MNFYIRNLKYQHLNPVIVFLNFSANSLPWEINNYTVCDNVDLKIVFAEYESYHQVSALNFVIQNSSIVLIVFGLNGPIDVTKSMYA